MRKETFGRDAVAIVALAGVAAAVSNALAGPERKLLWVGSYADAPAPRLVSLSGDAGLDVLLFAQE